METSLLESGSGPSLLRGGSWMLPRLGATNSVPSRPACDCQGPQGESIAFLRTGTFIKTQSHSPPSGVIHPSLSNSVALPLHVCHFFLPISVGKAVSPQPRGTRDHKGNDKASSQSLFGLLMEPSECKSTVSSLNPFLCWLRVCTWRAKLCCREQVSPQSSGSHCIC